MSKLKIVLLFMMAGFLLLACQQSQSLQQRLYIFGTLLDIEIIDSDRARSEEALLSLDHLLQRMHHDWHGWKPDGELYVINHSIAAGVERMPVSEFVAPLIIQSQQLYQLSDGLFNPAMGRLIDLWGFHQDQSPSGAPPNQRMIQALMADDADMADVEIKDGYLYSQNAMVEFDFGGFAKGYALDMARQQLQRQGIKHAILNAGGDLCAMGTKGRRPWRVGIRHPQGEGVLAALDVVDGECVMTSGNYERYREHEGVHYAHILDPRTGQPVVGIVSVTVIHADGGLADAAATALTVAGREGWLALAKKMGLQFVMLVDDDGTIYMSQAMAERIVWQGTTPDNIIIRKLN